MDAQLPLSPGHLIDGLAEAALAQQLVPLLLESLAKLGVLVGGQHFLERPEQHRVLPRRDASTGDISWLITHLLIRCVFLACRSP